MQTILGSGGAIGVELAKELKNYTNHIRLVSRNPKKVNDSDELFQADLLNAEELQKAIEGSEIVYVTVGFPYKYKIWQESWPKFVRNLLSTCEKENCELVFFDNIYMYDRESLNGMTEDAPVNPSSKKGTIRTEVAKMIMDKISDGSITGLIARSADFYGPSIKNNSVLTETVFNPISKGKPANLLISDSFKHSYTYTPDAAKATAILGNSDKAYGQVWHLPTAGNPLTGKQWVEKVAEIMGKEPKYRVASRFMIRIISLFVPVMRESFEMMYQYDRDYVFDSSKFEKEFDFKPTSYDDGIREIVERDYQKT